MPIAAGGYGETQSNEIPLTVAEGLVLGVDGLAAIVTTIVVDLVY